MNIYDLANKYNIKYRTWPMMSEHTINFFVNHKNNKGFSELARLYNNKIYLSCGWSLEEINNPRCITDIEKSISDCHYDYRKNARNFINELMNKQISFRYNTRLKMKDNM